MSKPNFQISLTGDVKPDTTRAGDLAEFLLNFETAVLETAAAQGITLNEDDGISLINIEEGSNRLSLSASSVLVGALSALSVAVSSNDFSEVPYRAHERLHEISKQAEKKHWGVCITANSSLKIEEAEISSKNPVSEPSLQTVIGATTLVGKVEMIGGDPPRVYLRISNQERRRIEVAENVARLLADRLYETVSIDGEATWNTSTWDVEKFKASSISEYQDTDPLEAFEKLAKASKGRWDGVDVTDYVKKVRSEEGIA